jgi:TetR/AcrR family transcriptional regulator, regulator of cefoperazone and chloramphenicol sensitivity
MFDIKMKTKKLFKVGRRSVSRAGDAAALDSTRGKLLEAAGQVFAERGFYGTTVREICKRTGANIAAVNYHFGDKLGLYTEVLRQSVFAARVEPVEAALDQNAPPEDILRLVIKTRLQSVARGELPDWHFRIMIHEFAHPSPVISRVINEISRPIYRRFLELTGKFVGLPPDDEKTQLCAQSVMGQVLLYVMQAPLLMRVWPELKMTPEQVERIADHIADFSLAYLRQLREQAKSRPGSQR